jgi:hypothetical protein
MKYIISENKLSKVFDNFMDHKFNLSHNGPKMLVGEDGEVFGYIGDSLILYVQSYPGKILYTFFGDRASDLLYEYLHNRFPNIGIDAVAID